MYNIIKIVSVIIRQFYLPNPFEPIGNKLSIEFMNMKVILSPEIMNWMAEPFLHLITFAVVGIYYSKGVDKPAKGSFLYLLFYGIHVGLIYLISILGFAPITIVAVIICYIALHIAVNILKNKLLYGGI